MTSYELISDKIGDLPYLLLSPATAGPSAPLVLALHGLGSKKEKILPMLYAFAQAGLRVAALDARQHGERLDADDRERRLGESYVQTMHDLISGTARDISALLDHLGAERVGIHGISLGGYIAFAALLTEPRLAVASIAMGSPDWLGPLREMGIDLSQPAFAPLLAANPLDQAEFSYGPRPVLMLHGSDDEVVSPAGVRSLQERLRPSYADAPERMQLVIYPGVGHEYTADMQERSIAWIKRFL